jgi:hypothetical protein
MSERIAARIANSAEPAIRAAQYPGCSGLVNQWPGQTPQRASEFTWRPVLEDPHHLVDRANLAAAVEGRQPIITYCSPGRDRCAEERWNISSISQARVKSSIILFRDLTGINSASLGGE